MLVYVMTGQHLKSRAACFRLLSNTDLGLRGDVCFQHVTQVFFFFFFLESYVILTIMGMYVCVKISFY